MATLNPREERGLVIAATQQLTQKGKVWLVPSASGRGKYTVSPDPEFPYCSCPDFEETGCRCKHLYAVEYTMKRDTAKDGTVTETRTVTFTAKKTYSPRAGWGVYNLAACEEKRRFLVLLHDLVRGLEDLTPSQKGGRPRTALRDTVFTCVYKVFSTFSGRRFCTDLDDAFEKGYLTRRINGIMAWQFMEWPKLTEVLQQLVTMTALPLRAIETTFAPDSTGFSTSRFVRWTEEKYGTRSGRDWVKAHCIAGCRTHVITAVNILDRDAADCPQFKPLVEKTAAHFNVKEVPADKAYLSHENLQLVHDLGGTAYIPFKSNSVQGEAGTVWERMYHFYSMHREEFEKRYHQRSQAESAFSMLKAKFKDSVRSKVNVAMANEVLCKVVAHNICCLIMSQVELGIDVQFWGETAPAVEPVASVDVEPVVAAPVECEPVEPIVSETPRQTRPDLMCGA